MSNFSDLVARANGMVRGIDWDALETQGRGVPLDPNVPAKLGYWVDYLAPGFNQAAAVMDTLYYDPTVVNAAATTDALDVMYRMLQDISPGAQAMARLNDPSLIFDAIPLRADEYRLFISFIWGVVMYGVKLHTTFAITALGRQAWRTHADHLVMMCNAIVLLDQFKLLDRLRWNSEEMVALRQEEGVTSLQPYTAYLPTAAPTPPTTSGLGSPVIALAGIVIAGIVLMYGIYEWTTSTAEMNKQTLDVTKQLCSDPNYANDTATRDRCVTVLSDALARTTLPKLPTSDLTTYLMYGLFAAAAIYFAPVIVRSLRAAQREAKA